MCIRDRISTVRIESMISKGSLATLYDAAKVEELEKSENLTGKEQKKLCSMKENYGVYEYILSRLRAESSEQIYYSPNEFIPVLTVSYTHLNVRFVELECTAIRVSNTNQMVQSTKISSIMAVNTVP